jgi:hypothetical protein
VIENMYEIRITNSEQVIEAITEKKNPLDEQRILTISTSLNSWVAMNPFGYGRGQDTGGGRE